MSWRRRTSVAAAVALAGAIGWLSSASAHETVNTTVLFDREIVRILDKHCVMCHTEGGPSFPLETYEQAWLARRKMTATVIGRTMPPWPAFAGYGRFANENAVTLRESQFLVSWMEGLGPRNAGKVFTNTSDPTAPKTQAVRAHAEFGGWHLGRPDLVKEIPATLTIDLGLTVERRLRAFEFKPADRTSVHAAVFTIKETGQWVASWTPWYGFVEFPRGTAFQVPAGAHLVASIQGSGGGEVGLFFDPAPAGRTVSDLVVDAIGSTRLHGETTLPADTTLLALRPDVQPGTTSVEVSARRADGGTDVLLFAKNLSTEWPTPFIFAEPVTLRKGTTLAVTAYGRSSSLKTTFSTVVAGPSPRTSTPPARRSR